MKYKGNLNSRTNDGNSGGLVKKIARTVIFPIVLSTSFLTAVIPSGCTTYCNYKKGEYTNPLGEVDTYRLRRDFLIEGAVYGAIFVGVILIKNNGGASDGRSSPSSVQLGPGKTPEDPF